MALLKSDCRKFAPNIFNKTKCQNCFRGKDVHSAEALESNRATRKVCLCGYLFVAPDWDFSLPANRNKRWQRRWFVLYDDGELAYSVDECPETVPQAVIDMNCVLEVTDAENVTGNQYALAITLSEKVHFIKGTSKEESKKWFEVLSRFPRNTVCGKYKRSATFPGVKAISSPKSENNFTDWVSRRGALQISECAKNSCNVNGPNRNSKNQNSQARFHAEDDDIPTKDTNCSGVNKNPSIDQQNLKDTCENTVVNCTALNDDSLSTSIKTNGNDISAKSDGGKIENNASLSKSLFRETIREKLQSKADNCRKHLKTETKESRKQHSHSDITPMIPSLLHEKSTMQEWKRLTAAIDTLDCSGKNYHHNPVYVLMSDVPSGRKYDTCEKFFKSEKLHALRRQSSFGKKSDLSRQVSSWREEENELGNRTIHKSASVPNAVILDDKNHLPNGSVFSNLYASSKKSKLASDSKFCTANTDKALVETASLERGDPDGCNLDSPPSFCDLNNEQSSEVLSLKKGWLVKQDQNKWNKHWFVLRNSALTYYTDPIAEDSGILDGMIDLRKVQCVSEVQSSSGHTFCILMKDSSKLFLSAVTSKMRNNWIRAILQGAKLKATVVDEVSKKKNNMVHPSRESPVVLKRNPSISSADSETMFEKQNSKNLAEDDESEDLQNHSSVTLPLSPPLARTAISRVKERARSRSHSRSRASRYASTEITETDHNYLADSDDGTTDHSSSSLSNTPILLPKEGEKPKATPVKVFDEKNRTERRRSLKLSGTDIIPFQDRKKKVLDIKDKLEDSSWAIWLDVSKFCKEVEAKLDDIEKINKDLNCSSRSNDKSLDHSSVSVDKKKEIGHLVACLVKVEKRLHKVHNELEKAKVDLLLSGKETSLESATNKTLACLSSLHDIADISSLPSQNFLLAQQFNKLKEENRRLKQDVKTSQTTSDNFELNCISLKQELKQKQDLHQSQMDLMVARVDDLTMKLLNSEKNVRQLRQRVMKLEQRQERRRSSLKGKEALTLSKEYESKLCELEQKIDAVEVALKGTEELNESVLSSEKEAPAKDSQNMLMRLHNLDKKVKDVSEIVDQSGVEQSVKTEDFMKPKICLQVKPEENMINHETCEDWNSLSLSTSMTDLTNPDNVGNDEEGKNIALSFHDCLENLNYKVTSLISWLKTNLQLMCDESSVGGGQPLKSDVVHNESSIELKHLVQALEHASNVTNNTAVITQDVNDITKNVLYKIVLLQEITNVVFRMSNFEKYKAAVLFQHLTRIKQAILDIEQYIAQKSNSVSIGSSKVTLCNIVANLLFYRVTFPPTNSNELPDIEKLYEEVESSKKRVATTVFIFKEKFIENFCTTILELSENSHSDKPFTTSSLEKESDSRPLGQKQFLSHVNHIITQVSHSFVAHISKSLNEIYFLCPNVQYSTKWTSYICKLLQQELIRLSSEIKSICIKHLENDFYSGSKCGVLVEYMHCSIWELAQVVSINSVVEGTSNLIKDAIYGKNGEHLSKSRLTNDNAMAFVEVGQEDLNIFHQGVLQRAMSIMSNLPMYPYLNAPWGFCNTGEINVAHRSVSSLLCFKQKLKSTTENERKLYKAQIEQLNQKLNALWEEQKKREREGCKTCIELRQEVSYLQAELDESRSVARSGSLCEKCTSLKSEIQKLMEQHERDTFLIQKMEEQEENWKQQMEDVVREKEKMFDEEKRKFALELQSAQQLLRSMENQYDEDLNNLQSLYEKKLSQPQTDLWRYQYSTEIDQLKSLCERGLETMEVTHKRIISELEQRHQKELDQLTVEREKVLAEEAHATAVALEAVRKAHKEELQRQIQIFKEDFVKKMNSRIETEAFKKGYETEISKVKQEILAITEKYSIKCLENISLQENLETMSEQLKACNSQVAELQVRNKQLRARLDSESMQKLEELV